MLKRYSKKIRAHFEEVVSVKNSPRSIALGFAVGTAIALLPTFGLGPLIGLGVILIFKKISKVSLFASFLVWNFIVLALLVPIEYKIGNFLFGNLPVPTYKIEILNQIFFYSRNLLFGNIILTIILTSFSYFLVYFFAKKYQKQYIEKIQEPLEKVIEKVDEGVKKIEEKVQNIEGRISP